MNFNLTLIMQAVAFGLFIWFCAKFVWPPLMRAIETRQKQIADGLAAGEQGRRELASAEKRDAEMLAEAKARSAEIVSIGEKYKSDAIEQSKIDAKAEADYTVIIRDDGSKQWAYKGKPLYTWVKDTKPGEISGDGVAANTWHIARP